jgi:hypothetical protein
VTKRKRIMLPVRVVENFGLRATPMRLSRDDYKLRVKTLSTLLWSGNLRTGIAMRLEWTSGLANPEFMP